MFLLFPILLFISLGSWAKAPIINKEIYFSNRAKCAQESKKPATDILVILSNMEIGRSLLRLGQTRKDQKAEDFVALGLNKYRYTVLSLLELVHRKISDGSLPILPVDFSQTQSEYARISRSCAGSSRCQEMDNFIENAWIRSSSKKTTTTIFSKPPILSCAYLKKFTPLEAHLFGTKPTAELLEQVAKSTKKADEFYSDCHDYTKQENQKISTYELSLNHQNEKNFESIGFDYWNSIKIYFSWAFRNSREATQLSYPFDMIFSSIAIEDSLFMLPNGCRSITTPKCDPATLSQNSLRLFAKHDFRKNANELDFFRAIPEGASQQIISDPFTTINQDILDLGKFDSSDAWADNLRQNFSDTRFTMRKKFVTAMTQLSLISKSVTPNKTEKFLESYFSKLGTGEATQTLKSEYYYLCSENVFFDGTEVSFLKPKLGILKELNLVDDLTDAFDTSRISDLIGYYEGISKVVSAFCSKKPADKVFEREFQIDQSGFSPWYTDYVFQGKVISTRYQARRDKLSRVTPLLSYRIYQSSKDIRDVICIDPVDCARTTIQSLVDLYSVIQYADLFLELKNEILSPGVFNPYSERFACGAYDPWFKTKSSLFALGTDVAQAGLAAVTPGVVYGHFDLQPGRVTSFNQLVKEGKIVIDPRYDRAKVISAVALDLGALTNIPCSVSVTRSKNYDPSKFLAFRGLSLRTCRERETNTISVNVNEQNGQQQQSYVNGCVQCSLDFEHITSVAANAIPFGRTTFFMVRGIYRLYKGMKDPANIPRSWSVNPYFASASFDSHGGRIPPHCVPKLSAGETCMKNRCDERILKAYAERGVSIDAINSTESWRRLATVRFTGCRQETVIKVSPRREADGEDSCDLPKSAPINCGSEE
jgi:hypothetical protein